MPDSSYQFYECDNPGCQMRFPGTEGQPRWNRCPVCRSTLHVVATLPRTSVHNGNTSNAQPLNIEAMRDNIRSAWNVGSIFRTADGLSVRKLYLCGITASPDNSKVGKTALGAEANITWEKHNNAVHLAAQFRSGGSALWALEDQPGATDLFDLSEEISDQSIVLVVGNEACGVDPGVIDLCDRVIAIPMLGKKQSYNVAVAFAIAASFLIYCQIFSHGSRRMLPNT